MKLCRGCGQSLPLESYYTNRNMRDGHLNWCKTCMIERFRDGRKARAAEFRARVQAIKMERGCVDCGYRDHPAALDFDHLPGFEKGGKMASMACGSKWTKIEAEIAKCEVVCANCHRVRTAERRGHSDQAAGERSTANG